MIASAAGNDVPPRPTTVACAAALHNLGEATLSEIARTTGLSRPTVKERLDELSHLVEVTPGADHGMSPTPSGGRPASRFRFRNRYGFAIGAEIGKHDERILVCDLAGRIQYISEHHYPAMLSGRERIAVFKRRLSRVVNRLQAAHDRWVGIGIAMTGGVAADGRISRSPLFPDIEGLSLGDVGLVFGDVPVIVENDLNTAAIAEHAYGAARGVDTFALVLAWHKLAAGIVLNDRIHRGTRNLAGELNLINDVEDGRTSHTPDSWTDPDTFLEVIESAMRDEPESLEQLNEFARRAAHQLAYLTLAIDPQLIVLGGPLAHNRMLTERISEQLTRLLRNGYSVDLAVTQFPTFGPSLGALQMTMTNAFALLLGEPAFPARIDVHVLHPDYATEHRPASSPALQR